MPCSYRQCVTMFTEELPWLKGRDPERGWVGRSSIGSAGNAPPLRKRGGQHGRASSRLSKQTTTLAAAGIPIVANHSIPAAIQDARPRAREHGRVALYRNHN